MKILKSPKPGDLFYIPAVDASETPGFVIARYIELIPPALGHLVEVFARFYTHIPSSIAEVDTSHRLFRPIFCSMRFSDIPRWKILFSDPDYKKTSSNYESIQFAFGSKIWIGAHIQAATPEQLSGVEPSICWRMDHIIYRVIAHLRHALNENDCMGHFELPEDLRVGNDVAFERVNKAAHSMQELFDDK
jgi:hypothetical protein